MAQIDRYLCQKASGFIWGNIKLLNLTQPQI
jgi:hypothetical protein